MGLLDRVTGAVSTAYDKVSDTVSTTVDKVEQKVVTAEKKVEAFAKSEFEEVKSYAKATGAQVYKKAEETIEKAGSYAKEQGIRLPQGVTGAGGALWDKVTGKSSDATREAGGNLDRTNGGDPNEKVDLNDPAKVHQFLETYGQKDRTDDTDSDGARCQANVIVAGLLLKGGPAELQKGLETAKGKANEELKTATGGRKKALERAVQNLDAAIDGLKSGKPTRGQLDRAADAMFHVMAKDAPYKDDGSIKSGYTGVDQREYTQMEGAVGLTQGQSGKDVDDKWFFNPVGWGQSEEEEAAVNTWDEIKPGQRAHVGVNLYGENGGKGAGPNGEDIQTTSNGTRYYEERGTGTRINVTGDVNHAVIFGKNPDGTRYIYNPIGDPPYVSEKPGDAESSKKIDRMSAELMARKRGTVYDDQHARVTTYD